ncbi:MAG: polymer-forming cytoskeletal protein [Flavobacteriaceae bacterium]
MKPMFLVPLLFLPLIFNAQKMAKDVITIKGEQKDDIYVAGGTVKLNTPIHGDAVLAGGTIMVNDSVKQDLVVAGGEVSVHGYIGDDIRAGGGRLTIDSEIGDDVIIAGGEVFIGKNAVIHGNVINFSGDISMDGMVMGKLKSYSGDLKINGKVAQGIELYGANIEVNGEIRGPTKMVAEKIAIGEDAQFYGDIVYWSDQGEVDFKNSLKSGVASFDDNLRADNDGFPWKGMGIAALGFWLYYLVSALLILVLLNFAFGKPFSGMAQYFQKFPINGLGYGLLYVFGVPIIILISFLIIVGIPLGLFLGAVYLFSLLFGHLFTALLISHYFNDRSGRSWNFWSVVFLALAIAATLRLLTLIPFLGILISILVIATGYGLIALWWLDQRKKLKPA